MIGVAIYGPMLAATSGGALVSIARALVWSRQLRLTPLRPPANIAIKLLIAMLLELASVGIVYTAGAFDGVQMAPAIWVLIALLAWGGALVFASFGLVMGYLLPSENVTQNIGPILTVFGLVGGLFAPVSLLPSAIRDIAPYIPSVRSCADSAIPPGRRDIRRDLDHQPCPLVRRFRDRGNVSVPARYPPDLIQCSPAEGRT